MPSALTRIQSSPVIVTTPHSTSLSVSGAKCSGRQPRTVTSPRVTAPASSSVPVTMRSGMISYSTPCSSSTPSMTIVSVPWPEIFRAHRDEEVCEVDDFGFHRDVASTSSFLRRVPPRASRSSSRRRSACETRSRPRCSRATLRFGDEIAVRVMDVASQRDEGLLVHVRRARAEHAAAGQRNLGAAEAAQERADDVERSGQLAHERVGRAIGCDVARIDRHRVRRLRSECARPSASSSDHITETSVIRGTRWSVTVPRASNAAAMIGSAAFFAPCVATEPSRRAPPRTRSVVSSRSSILRLPFA